jgi:hypothetical protein
LLADSDHGVFFNYVCVIFGGKLNLYSGELTYNGPNVECRLMFEDEFSEETEYLGDSGLERIPHLQILGIG